MNDEQHHHPAQSQRRKVSLAQMGLGARTAIAVGLVAAVWAVILPLVL